MVRTSNPDHFCIVLPFFRPLGVPLYAFGANKKASCTFLNSPTACRKYFSTSWCGVISLRFFVLLFKKDKVGNDFYFFQGCYAGKHS